MRILLFLFIVFFSFDFAVGGTLLYRGTKNEQKIISEIDIISIDKPLNLITFKIGKSTRTIPFAKMIKYYDSDINMNLAYDDNTSDYNIRIYDIKIPINHKGITAKKVKKDRSVNKFSFRYDIIPKTQKGQRKIIKSPHFYLFLLTASSKSSGRRIITYHYPELAKLKNTRIYNEALMLERAISAERHMINPSHHMHGSGVSSTNNTVTFELKEVGNREIIAYYLVVWGKDSIVKTEQQVLNNEYNITRNWHIHTRDMK